MKARGIALTVVVIMALLATSLFLWQGGFGAGHLDYDLELGLLGVPWAFLPWPAPVYRLGDYVWLIAIPCALNLSCVLGFFRLLKTRRVHLPTNNHQENRSS